jgi:UbiD family decarboxylase
MPAGCQAFWSASSLSLEGASLPYADFVIEGYVDPREMLRDERPFGDHTRCILRE